MVWLQQNFVVTVARERKNVRKSHNRKLNCWLSLAFSYRRKQKNQNQKNETKNQQRYIANTALNAGNESYILPNLPQSLTYTCLCFHSMCHFLHRKNSVQQSKPRNEISEHHHIEKEKLSEGKEVDKIILIC